MLAIDLPQIASLYIVWHYSRALHDYFALWENSFRFILHFFSMSLLARTFFSPFHRLRETPPRGFHPTDYVASMTVNMIMRIVGILMRFILLLAGFLGLVLVAVSGLLFFIAWIFLPVLVLALLILGSMYFVS